MRFRCNECAGEYDDVDAEDVAYFHACPPQMQARVLRAGNWIFVDLAQIQGTDSITVQRGAQRLVVLVSGLLPDDVRLDDRFRERPAGRHRDENSPRRRDPGELDPSTRRRIRAIGQGRTPL
ncbi:MAG: hypothetical protein WBC33_07780 [Conexibacter sp.]